MNARIAKEIADRLDKLMETDELSVSIERKKLYVLSEIAVILAGLLDAKLEELGAKNDEA